MIKIRLYAKLISRSNFHSQTRMRSSNNLGVVVEKQPFAICINQAYPLMAMWDVSVHWAQRTQSRRVLLVFSHKLMQRETMAYVLVCEYVWNKTFSIYEFAFGQTVIATCKNNNIQINIHFTWLLQQSEQIIDICKETPSWGIRTFWMQVNRQNSIVFFIWPGQLRPNDNDNSNIY